MTEGELINLGFEKVTVTDAQSQNGYDYYFYQKELCSGLVLHSTDNIDVKNNEWSLKSFDIPSINIIRADHYKEFLEIIGNITC
jgi:hypothetical protein